MSCTRPKLIHYLQNFTGQDPLDAVVCAYRASEGAGMGPVFGMMVFAGLGVGLSIRAQHPGPVLVAGVLSIGLFAASLPGAAIEIVAIVLVVGIAAAGLFLYISAQSRL